MSDEGERVARCGLCGEPVAQMFGDQPTPAMREMMVIRCVACAASEAADRILTEATKRDS